MTAPYLSIEQCATLACVLEATAPKPGNVHRGADFEDLTYPQLLVSAVAIAPAMGRAAETRSLGRTVLDAIHATRSVVETNTNLGIVLLIAPLASVARGAALRPGVAEVLGRLTAEDAAAVYEAIGLAEPGGLGTVERDDVADRPPTNLIAAMRSAAHRDMVARQYAENFAQVLDHIVPSLARGIQQGRSLLDAIVQTHLATMSRYPDSLIARKLGQPEADKAASRAAQVLASGPPGEAEYQRRLAEFDFWLRSHGHRRNPGTTADLVTAGLFAALRDGIIQRYV